MKLNQSSKKKAEEIKKITFDLIKSGFATDLIGTDSQTVVKMALSQAKLIYESKVILDSMNDEDIIK